MIKKGYKVGLLDLDIYGPSLPIILGINEQPEMTNNKTLVPLDVYGLKVMSFGFISGNDTPVIWRGPLVSRMTEQFFKDVEWGDLDYLILDLQPGTGHVQLTLTQKLRMSGAIIVTTPQDIALSDVRKGADMFKKVKTPILGVVENMSGLIINGTIEDSSGNKINGGTITTDFSSNCEINNNGEFELTLDLFKKGGGLSESERLDIPLLGQIPISNDIVSATDNGEPLIRISPDHKASKVYNSIMVNRGLSYFADTVLYANEINKHHHLYGRLQFEFIENLSEINAKIHQRKDKQIIFSSFIWRPAPPWPCARRSSPQMRAASAAVAPRWHGVAVWLRFRRRAGACWGEGARA